jgi:cell division septation protein DedD
MPYVCPHCSAEIADDSTLCLRCGQPGQAGTEQTPDRRAPLWNILPWALLAVALLLLLPPLLRSHTKSLTAAAPLSAAPLRNKPAETSPAPASAVPLTVTLYSAGSGKHVPVGKAVTISAYAALPPGESATLAVSYGKEGAAKSLLSLAQGSLSSTVWTPLAPGHYQFIASALDSRKNSVFSRSLLIYVDAPAAPPNLMVKPTAPIQVAIKPVIAKPLPAKSKPVLARPKLITAKRTAPKHSAAKPAPKPRVKPASARSSYHVAAASFVYKPIAETLAGALRQRGFHAFVQSSIKGKHPRMYQVETGNFARPEDAQKQMQLLQHDGYPAYQFQER